MSVANADTCDLGRVFRLVYGHGAAKRIARAHGLSIAAAKKLLAGEVPPSRMEARCRQLRRDLLLLDAEITQARIQLDQILGDRPCAAVSRPGRGGEPPDSLLMPGSSAFAAAS